MSIPYPLNMGPRPALIDLCIFRGNTTNSIVLTFKKAGTPIDITNFDFVFRAVNPFGGTLFRKNVGNGMTILDGPEGKLTIESLAPEDTRKMYGAPCEYEIEAWYSQRQETWVKGRLFADGGNNDD